MYGRTRTVRERSARRNARFKIASSLQTLRATLLNWPKPAEEPAWLEEVREVLWLERELESKLVRVSEQVQWIYTAAGAPGAADWPRERGRQTVRHLHATFGGLRFEVEDEIAEGDRGGPAGDDERAPHGSPDRP